MVVGLSRPRSWRLWWWINEDDRSERPPVSSLITKERRVKELVFKSVIISNFLLTYIFQSYDFDSFVQPFLWALSYTYINCCKMFNILFHHNLTLSLKHLRFCQDTFASDDLYLFPLIDMIHKSISSVFLEGFSQDVQTI